MQNLITHSLKCLQNNLFCSFHSVYLDSIDVEGGIVENLKLKRGPKNAGLHLFLTKSVQFCCAAAPISFNAKMYKHKGEATDAFFIAHL